MQINDFKAIVATFADPGTELLFDKSQIVVSVNGDLITGNLTAVSGDVYVDEGSGAEPASKWVLTRLARLPLLATRLRESIAPMEYFVSPAASLLPTLETGPQEQTVTTTDALAATVYALRKRSPLEATVLYVTSDAGEGKTFLINQLARTQAERFATGETDYLVVPIPLGGRHFLRFDDITVGVLQNRYRFPFLYYNSFLALVKMGVIVPAFDGFEEMFVEGSSGEALSAMGILVGSLDSQGAVIVAARKAYFEFENLRTQERLFDTIRTFSVGFGKLELKRWERPQFIAYCTKRGIEDPEAFYTRVSERLTVDHALLTRAVLVKRLVDVAVTSSSLNALLEKLSRSGADFFAVFVRELIEREASEKWIDRSGEREVGTPLMSVDEHCDLLSQVAIAMWEARVDYLKRDYLEFVADYFCELAGKNAFQAQQIRERIRGHAMLVPSPNAPSAVEFDHDEFRLFFLGEGLASQLKPVNDRAKADIFGAFRRGVLPRQAQHALVRAVTRGSDENRLEVIKLIDTVSRMDAQASYTQENCGEIIIRLLNGINGSNLSICSLAFGTDALRDKKITGVRFESCYFYETSAELTELNNCSFKDTRFAQLRLYDSTSLVDVRFDNCTVNALVFADSKREFWDPAEIRRELENRGVIYEEPSAPSAKVTASGLPSPEVDDLEKIFRYFMRSTHISESVMLMKLGSRGQGFIDRTLPTLVRHQVMVEIDNRGGGLQRRYRLGVPLQKVNEAIGIARGSFDDFLEQFPEPM